MKDAEIAARLIEALSAAAGAGASLVSVEITMLTPGVVARVEARVARKTKTLAFLSAEGFSAAGERIATATSVHKLA
jgi:hypothetical protein